jgi:hypothetical protein
MQNIKMLQKPCFASNFDGGWENQIFSRHGSIRIKGINYI